jgi:hypothetical protein
MRRRALSQLRARKIYFATPAVFGGMSRARSTVDRPPDHDDIKKTLYLIDVALSARARNIIAHSFRDRSPAVDLANWRK